MQEAKKEVGLIFQKIPLIMEELGSIGKNKQAGGEGFSYKFRGIDDVYNAINELFAKHKVFTAPTVLKAEHEERKSSKGKLLIYRIFTIQYRFYAEDGSYFDSIVIGEGMDYSDKAGNKAMSVAHKYALLQVFCVPTEDPKDPENDSHEVKEREKPEDIDIAADSENEENEIKGIIEFVKTELKKQTIDYKDFKKFLKSYQKEFTPKRFFVGSQFGNDSLTVGKLDDLKFLKDKFSVFANKYLNRKMASKDAEDNA